MMIGIIVTVSLFIVGYLIQYFVFTAKSNTRLSILENKVVVTLGEHIKVLERLACLETRMEMYWGSIDGKLVYMLKSYPTNLEKDILLDRQLRSVLTLSEAERLRTIISCEFELEKTKKPEEKATGFMMAYILELGRLEQIIFDLTIIINPDFKSQVLKK